MKMRNVMIRALVATMIPALAFTGCSASRTAKGAGVGAGLGGLIGGIIGKQKDDTAKGAIVGAAVGGAAGAMIGRYMDKQAAEMEKELAGTQVERVGEGISVTFDSGILFAVNSSELSTAARENLDKFASILKEYPDTNILVEGHTDSDGAEDYNLKLSERRAQTVVSYCVGLGVAGSRFTTKGYGETQPVASNDTADGKRLNRRVQVAIMANEQLKKDAEEGKLQ